MLLTMKLASTEDELITFWTRWHLFFKLSLFKINISASSRDTFIFEYICVFKMRVCDEPGDDIHPGGTSELLEHTFWPTMSRGMHPRRFWDLFSISARTLRGMGGVDGSQNCTWGRLRAFRGGSHDIQLYFQTLAHTTTGCNDNSMSFKVNANVTHSQHPHPSSCIICVWMWFDLVCGADRWKINCL